MKARRPRSLAAILVSALAAAALVPVAAPAEPGPVTLASTNGLEQANRAESPALAANGRYIAFVGQIGGFTGILRKDLTTEEVVPVVAKSEAEGSSDASAPSISADGRYVSFTTTESLDPTDDPAPGTKDVYVADMSTSPPTYTLVSARDGSSQGLTYKGSGGSIASPRVAISANGNEVVFLTTAASDLTGAAGAAEAPALQVAVRDVAARRTILISTARDPLSGAALATTPVAGGGVYTNPILYPPGAALSADGSTVAWIGIHIRLQTAVPAAEAAAVEAADNAGAYTEPLWRRVPTAVDPAPETRRMATGARFPQMVSGENVTALNGCSEVSGWNPAPSLFLESTPGLSADGEKAAVIGEPTGYAEVYVFDLGGEPVAQQVTRAVPVAVNQNCSVTSGGNLAGAAAVSAVAISSGGDRVALATNRQRFPLAPPSLIGTPPLSVGLPEVYLADLSTGTLQRLTHGSAESEPSLYVESPSLTGIQFGARDVSFDADGETLAFASLASNLVPGDGNGELGASDAFLVTDPREPPKPGSSTVSGKPAPLRTIPRRILTARATSRPDGSVRVAVTVPAAGSLRALAKTNGGRGVKPRRVAAARRRLMLASTLAFDLVPARRFARRVRAAGGVEAKLRLDFNGPGGGPLHLNLQIRFHAHAKGRKGSHR